MVTDIEKPILWISFSKKDLEDMPPDVISEFGFGLYQAQIGKFPDIGKPLKGFGSANVIELCLNEKEGAFRTGPFNSEVRQKD